MFKASLTFLTFWLIALATHSAGLWKPMHSDFSMWLRVARDWDSGQTLYVDAYDNKQPTLFLLLRLIDSSNPRLSLYLAETLLAALGALALCAALRPMDATCAFLAPVLLIASTGAAATFFGGQCAEAIALWFDVIALSCFVLGAIHRSWWIMLAGGISFFLMVSFRIPTILHGLAYLPLTWALFQERGARSAFALLTSFAAGIGLALLALFAHAQVEGYWEPFLQVFARNLEYGSLSRVTLPELLLTTARTLWDVLYANKVLVVLSCISLVLAFGHCRRRPERLWLAISLCWLVGTVAGTLPGGRGFVHYAHHIWAPLSVLAVLWLARIPQAAEDANASERSSSRLSRRIALGITLGVLALGVGNDLLKARLWQKATEQGNERLQIIDQAADYLEDETSPEMTVPVCVWGDWAELYWRTPRPSVSRCVMPTCISEIEPDMFAEWVDAMVQTRPPLIVVDGTLLRPPGVTVLPYSDLDAIDRVAPFQRIIDDEYVAVRTFSHKDISTKLTFLARKNP